MKNIVFFVLHLQKCGKNSSVLCDCRRRTKLQTVVHLCKLPYILGALPCFSLVFGITYLNTICCKIYKAQRFIFQKLHCYDLRTPFRNSQILLKVSSHCFFFRIFFSAFISLGRNRLLSTACKTGDTSRCNADTHYCSEISFMFMIPAHV